MNIKIGFFILLTTTFVSADNLVIEDFENNRANWDPVSDRVMGGLSELRFSEIMEVLFSFDLELRQKILITQEFELKLEVMERHMKFIFEPQQHFYLGNTIRQHL